MPRQEQTCHNCAGDCCSLVSFVRSDEASPLQYDITAYSVHELYVQGFHEVEKPHAPCPAKSTYGCRIYEYRPRLCRSYFCHGRYWRAASALSSRNTIIETVTTPLQQRCREQSLRQGTSRSPLNKVPKRHTS
jgi:Fe-S-cluster containining protein